MYSFILHSHAGASVAIKAAAERPGRYCKRRQGASFLLVRIVVAVSVFSLQCLYIVLCFFALLFSGLLCCCSTNTGACSVQSSVIWMIPSLFCKCLLRFLLISLLSLRLSAYNYCIYVCLTIEHVHYNANHKYSAEMKIRQEVQMFEPLPSHLAYPDILEEYVAASTGSNAAAGSTEGRTSPRYIPHFDLVVKICAF